MGVDEELRRVVAEVLGSAPAQLGPLTAKQVLRRSSGRVLTTWRSSVDGRDVEVVTVVGDGGPRRDVLHRSLSDGTPVAAFRPRDDPRLPGLATALEPAALARLLGRPVTATARRRYRPLGRAVVEATTADGPVWCKVVRPAQCAELHELHRAVEAVVASPPVLAVDPELGLLVLGHLPGTSVRRLLRRDPGLLPPVPEVLDLAASLGAAATTRPVGRTPPLEGIDGHRSRLLGILPEDADLIEGLVADLAALARRLPSPGDTVTVHGDLHAAQLIAEGGRCTGLLDLDDVGLGHAVDDAARLVAHTACTALPLDDPRALAWSRSVMTGVLARHALELVAPRVAAVVLGLSLGPHRVQRPDWRGRTRDRLTLCRRWVTLADGP